MKKKCWRMMTDEAGKVKTAVRIGVMISIFIILLVGIRHLYYDGGSKWLVCVVYEWTGYYCPGCGAGRACYSLLHGQLYQAFRYNPLLVLLLPWLALYTGICGVQWLFTGKETLGRHIPAWVCYVVMSALILYGIVRNIDVYPFALLAPASIM